MKRLAAALLTAGSIAAGSFVPALLADESAESATSAERTVPVSTRAFSDAELGIAAASGDARQAIDGFQIPEGATVRVAAAEPEIANAVAFTFDGQMRLYVCETFRQSQGVEDNRGHMDWLEDDLAAQTVADRDAYIRKHEPDKVAEWSSWPDRIRRLTDRDELGRYTNATVFASFAELTLGTGAGVLAVENAETGEPDIYFTCIPDLFRLRDGDGDGQAEDVESLAHGFGVRFAFRGHDMHGLIRGIDGKLYWSIGDRGFHVLTKDGTKLHRPDTGAVFRANLDGTDLEVVATGLRNPQELAFNDTGDLFSVDNNSDSGDEARLVHIAEGSDAGWRMYYQYLEDRGPWNREAMWEPYREFPDAAEWVAGFDAKASETTGGVDPALVQPAYILPPVVNITDGPSGLVCYPGTGWGSELDNRFFIADFRGTASKSGVRSFAVETDGAFYEMTDDDQFVWQLLATDVDFGYDGSLYVMDWVDGWNGTGKARLYEFADPEHAAEADDVEQLFAAGFASLDSDRLADLLTHADRRVRLNAQWQLADRDAIDQLADVATSDAVPGRYHGIWGLGQIYAKMVAQDRSNFGGGDFGDGSGLVRTLLDSPDEEVVRQTLRALSWSGNADLAKVGLDGSKSPIPWERYVDASPRLQAAAVTAFGKLAAETEFTVPLANRFVGMLAANDDRDPGLRHAVVHALSQIGRDLPQDGSRERVLLTAIADGSDAVQRAGAVVLRRWKAKQIHKLLEGSPTVALEAARAIYDEPIPEAMTMLAAMPIEADTPAPLARRIAAANSALVGGADVTADAAKRLVEMAANSALPQAVREEAIAGLAAWSEGSRVDRTIGQYRVVEAKPASFARNALSQQIDALLNDDAVAALALPLVGQYELGEAAPLVAAIVGDASRKPLVRATALRSLERVAPQDAAALVDDLLTDDSEEVRSIARDVLSRVDPQAAVPVLANTLSSFGLREQQAAIATLAAMERADADDVLAAWLKRLDRDDVPAGIQLDLLEAAAERKSPALAELAAAYDRPNPDSLSDAYRMCLEGGSARAGETVFNGFAAAACRRCHVVNGGGAAVGPDLSEIGKEKTRQYLLEAIVEPNKAIAKGFGTKIVLMEDGRVLSGVVAEQTDETMTLVKPTGERVTVETDFIEAEKDGLSGMPADLYKQLSRRQIRDLVEYLASLTEKKATDGDEGGHE